MSTIYPSYNPNIPQPTMQAVAQKVLNAQQAFATLVVAFAAENIIMGITTSGKTGLIAEALQPVMYAGTSGSLWEAFKALENVVVTPDMAPFLTQDRLNWMKNQLQQAIAGL